MKFILSPARHMRDYAALPVRGEPMFPEETRTLAEALKGYGPWEMQGLLKANSALSYKAFVDAQEFSQERPGTAALLAYDGLVFKHLDPASLSRDALECAARTARIISALYGLLRPFDRVLPYRLEMRSRLLIDGGNLYHFWGDKIHRALYQGEDCVINLASEEYAQAVRRHLRPGDRFVDVAFYSMVKGRQRVVTTAAKMARGRMARYILEHKIARPEGLADFHHLGFAYEKKASQPDRYVFLLRDG